VRTIRRAQSKRNKDNQKLLEEKKKLQRLKQLQLADYTRIITRLRSHIITCSKATTKNKLKKATTKKDRVFVTASC